MAYCGISSIPTQISEFRKGKKVKNLKNLEIVSNKVHLNCVTISVEMTLCWLCKKADNTGGTWLYIPCFSIALGHSFSLSKRDKDFTTWDFTRTFSAMWGCGVRRRLQIFFPSLWPAPDPTLPAIGLTTATLLSFAAAYFFLQVIYARRLFGISPPKISGPPEFERIFRAQ